MVGRKKETAELNHLYNSKKEGIIGKRNIAENKHS